MKIKKKELFFFIGIILFLLKSWASASLIFDRLLKYDNALLLLSYLCFSINILINIRSESLKNIRNIYFIIRNWYNDL